MKKKIAEGKNKARKGGSAGNRLWQAHRLEGVVENVATRKLPKKKLPAISTQHAYAIAGRADGLRVLVDRLWPRGVSKSEAKIDVWAKEVAPSTELRNWFHANPEKRLKEFSKRYAGELKKNGALKDLRKEIRQVKTSVTLVTAVKELEHSHIPTLLKLLKLPAGAKSRPGLLF